MILERSKTEAVLQTGSASKGLITFSREFVKPISSGGLPRLSSARTNIVEAAAPSSSTAASEHHHAGSASSACNVETSAGMSATTRQVTEAASPAPVQAGSSALGARQPLLTRRTRALVSFHCSPFDTGAVRVAVSAPVAPQRENTVIYNTPYGWVPPIVAASKELPSHIEPIHPLPPAPQRQHTTWETIDGHWRNEQRANIMKRLQHINSNEMLAKMYYGTKEEIDSYKKHMRGILKQQMEEQWVKSRKRFHVDLSESQAAIAYDRECLKEDERADWQKRMYLRQFAFDNRKLADQRVQRAVEEQKKEKEIERKVLVYNPINWSGTMT